MNSKFFAVKGVQSTDQNDKIDCSSRNTYVNPYVLSVYPLPFNITATNNLITTIHAEQWVVLK